MFPGGAGDVESMRTTEAARGGRDDERQTFRVTDTRRAGVPRATGVMVADVAAAGDARGWGTESTPATAERTARAETAERRVRGETRCRRSGCMLGEGVARGRRAQTGGGGIENRREGGGGGRAAGVRGGESSASRQRAFSFRGGVRLAGSETVRLKEIGDVSGEAR